MLALVPLPGAAAKAFAEDPAGDAQVTLFGSGLAPAPAGVGEAADLLALDIAETAEEIVFTMKLQNLKQSVSFAEYEISFTWAKTEYGVRVWREVAQGVIDDESNAYLYDEREGRWNAIANLEHMIDVDAGTIMVHVPKAYILSENGKYPLLGDTLQDIVVEAYSRGMLFSFSADAYDRLPDKDALRYAFQFGDLVTGDLRLDATERVRVSNGGSTTFVYQVTIANRGDADHEVDIALTDLPAGWNGTVQSPVRVPADAERRIAVLMSVPFAHDHGGFSSFNVSIQSRDDAASRASIRMGVLHTPIPQPAGHHADLYLHARSFNSGIFGQVFPWTGATMNTEADHSADTAEASPWRGGDRITWRIPLDPALRMGLDFDLTRTGELVGSIVGRMRSTGTVHAELVLVTPEGDDGVLLGDTTAAEVTLDLSNPTPFKVAFMPTQEADYIPYARGQNLVLYLYYEPAEEGVGTICCLPGATPGLRTEDFKLTLPLNEYHDKLSGLAEAGDLLELRAQGPVEKAGVPGSTMTYRFTLTNRGHTQEIIKVDLAGTDAALGTLVPAGAIRLGAKESREITVAVAIPFESNDGEELEVLVFAHAQSDPSKSAIARTKTLVAKSGAADVHPDESGILTAAQRREASETPAPGALLLGGALAGAALMLRRRHG